MSNINRNESVFSMQLIAAGLVGAASLAYLFTVYKRKSFPFNFLNPLRNQRIQVINTEDECRKAVNNIKSNSLKYKVLGFDCEWVTKDGLQHPIALLQLASQDGYCALFRLSNIQYIPQELKNILEDSTILKVGVAPVNDAKYLFHDYAVKVKGIVDLRYLSTYLLEKPDGLSNLGEKYLNVKMDKSWRIRCSDWEAKILSKEQINYAAADAFVAIAVFKKLTDRIMFEKHGIRWYFKTYDIYWREIYDFCRTYVDLNFKQKAFAQLGPKGNFKNILSTQQRESYKLPNYKNQKRNFSRLIQKKVLYQNCLMVTSSDEILCTCDRKKAEWYVEKELADIIDEDPYTIRLRFEPAGKCVGDVGRFYQMPRENRCVVCGENDSYIRKNVVPKEYRKLFPVVMKDHSSHDVLLLCLNCHQLSNMRDQTLRAELAEMCNAPIAKESRLFENMDLKKVKSAARALLVARNTIPPEKQILLENVLREFYPDEIDITDKLLLEASKLDHRYENPKYEPHGQLVVEYFKNNPGGLLKLEQLWREHFIKTMNPQYMPELWSITHTKSRLEIRAKEGRVEKEDLEIAGLSL